MRPPGSPPLSYATPPMQCRLTSLRDPLTSNSEGPGGKANRIGSNAAMYEIHSTSECFESPSSPLQVCLAPACLRACPSLTAAGRNAAWPARPAARATAAAQSNHELRSRISRQGPYFHAESDPRSPLCIPSLAAVDRSAAAPRAPGSEGRARLEHPIRPDDLAALGSCMPCGPPGVVAALPRRLLGPSASCSCWPRSRPSLLLSARRHRKTKRRGPIDGASSMIAVFSH